MGIMEYDGDEVMLDEGEAVQEEELMDTLRDLREKGELKFDDPDDEDGEEEEIEEDEEDDEDVPNEAKLTCTYHQDSVFSIALKEEGDSFVIATGGGDDIGGIFSVSKSDLESAEESIIINEFGK